MPGLPFLPVKMQRHIRPPSVFVTPHHICCTPHPCPRHSYYGIPVNNVDTNPSKGQVFPSGPTIFNQYASESDPGTYPFPLQAAIEGAYLGCSMSMCGGDRHVLAVDNYTCLLYESYNCSMAPASNSGEQHMMCGVRLKENRSWPGLGSLSVLQDKRPPSCLSGCTSSWQWEYSNSCCCDWPCLPTHLWYK